MNAPLFRLRVSTLTFFLALAFSAESFAQMEEIIVSARKREENLQDVPISITAFSDEEIQRLNIATLKDITQRTSSVILDQGFSPQDTRIVIRGLAPIQGRQNAAVLQDGVDISSQAIVTNGGSLMINPRLFDIERVEVVKGPQNALYGRSAFAGAINYITRKPTNELRSTVGADVGNNGRADIRAGISGPLVEDSLLGGINVAGWTHDGFYQNTITGKDVGGQSGKAIAGTLVWNATEKLSFNLRGEYTDDEFDVSPYFAIIPTETLPIPPQAVGTVTALSSINGFTGTIPDGGTNVGNSIVRGGVIAPTMSDNPRNPGNDYSGIEREITRVTLTADWELDPFDIVYLGHYGNQESTENEDGQRVGSVLTESTLTAGAELLFAEDNTITSHELRLQSNNPDAAFNWTVGALYWKQDQEFLDGSFNCVANTIFVPAPGPGLVPGTSCGPTIASVGEGINGAGRFPDVWGRDTEHWSGYFLIDWEFIENFTVVVEGRYTNEDVDVRGPDRAPPPLPPGAPNPFSRILDPRELFGPSSLSPQPGANLASESDSFFTPKITLEWTPSDDTLLYFSFAEGRKPSGFTLIGTGGLWEPDENRFEQERVDVWELGAKTAWLDNRLTINGAFFFQDYTDKQTSTQVVIGEAPNQVLGTRPVNASAAEVWGIELDALWSITENLNVSASYTYLNTEYKDFKILNSGAAPIALIGNCNVVDPTGNDPTCELDYSGKALEYAPENSFVGSATYRRAFNATTDWFIEGDLVFQDERFQDNANRVKFDAFTVFNFRLGVTTERWDLIAYVDNAFENEAVKTGFRSIYTPDFDFAAPPFSVVLPSGFQGIMPDLRQWGLRLNLRFGSQ